MVDQEKQIYTTKTGKTYAKKRPVLCLELKTDRWGSELYYNCIFIGEAGDRYLVHETGSFFFDDKSFIELYKPTYKVSLKKYSSCCDI